MLIIDVSMLVRRTHARMDFLTNSKGVHTGMEFGTLRTLQTLQKKYPEQEVVLCFDSPRNFKRERCPEYKAGRRPLSKDGFYRRFDEFKRLLRCLYSCTWVEGHEADELMYSITKTTPGPHIIYTNDHDLLQAVDFQTIVLKSFHSKLFTWDYAKVVDEYGLRPELLSVYFAFIGDKVDNILGVPRIPKTFLKDLINWCDECAVSPIRMLEEIKTANWKPKMKLAVAEFHDSGRWQRNYDLIKLTIVPCVLLRSPNDTFVKAKLKEWEIYSLKLSKQFGVIGNEEF